MEKSILEGNVTYDLARGREDATILSTSEFADSLVRNIQ
jgi:isocitrate dehydrogenase